MPAIEMRLLGPFEIRDVAGRPLPVRARKNRALLAALALAPSHALPRARMTSLLWSDRGDAQARSSLRQALLGLRSDLTPANAAALHISDDRASINPTEIGIDVVEFQRLAASDDVAGLRRAHALYRGELLADTFVQDPAFEDWLGGERQRLADIAVDVIERLCLHETGATRIELAKRLVAIDHLREASHRLLMQAYLDAGERALALRQYETCRNILRDELQIAPGEQTEAIRRRCREPSPSQIAASPGSRAIAQMRGSGAAPFVDDRPLVAVLPLQAFNSESEMESFCDGLTEDITTGLSRIAAIRVVARSTMFTYKHRAVDIRNVGHELGARYVLEGSVRSSSRNIRVAAQLIDAVSGHHIWAEQIDLVNGEVFELQNDITRSVVGSVQAQVILNEGRIAPDADEVTKAAPLLARAWRLFLGLTDESLRECRALAERALKLEPRNVTAHRMLAVSIYHLVYMGFAPWDRPTLDLLSAHARISVEGDGADEYCHWAMQCAYLLRNQHELAAASLRRALEINPNFSLAYGALGTVLAWSGDYDGSVRSNELALRFNPQDSSNFFRHFGLALAHYLAERPEKALPHARAAAQARSNWILAQFIYAATLVQGDRLDEAKRTMNEMKAHRPDLDASRLALLPFARAADRERLSRDLRLAGLPD